MSAFTSILRNKGKMFNIILILNKMASIARMVGGAIINASAFVGGTFLARYLSGRSDNDEEKSDKISPWKNTRLLTRNMKKIK